MLTATIVAHDVPRLRRYARALTGSQQSGDAYVAATLEALVEDPSLLADEENPTVAIFRVFTGIWNSVGINKAGGDPVSGPVDRHVTSIAPRPRQAFLLMALEEFDTDQAAAILGVSADKVKQLVDQSGRELASEIATDVLIIEDEPLIAMDLEALAEGLGHRVTGVARTHREALTLAKAKPPGLILADIRLADRSSGIDAVNDLLKSFEVPVIFITAYPEQLLTGERPEPTFLVSKPFRPATVAALISQALLFEQTARPKGRLAPA